MGVLALLLADSAKRPIWRVSEFMTEGARAMWSKAELERLDSPVSLSFSSRRPRSPSLGSQ